MVNDYKKMGKAPKTIRNFVNLVSVMLRQAKADNYIRRDSPDPKEFLKMPKMESQEGNVYSMEQGISLCKWKDE